MPAGDTWPSLAEFYADRPERGASPEAHYGSDWHDGDSRCWDVRAILGTGEVYGERDDGLISLIATFDTGDAAITAMSPVSQGNVKPLSLAWIRSVSSPLPDMPVVYVGNSDTGTITVTQPRGPALTVPNSAPDIAPTLSWGYHGSGCLAAADSILAAHLGWQVRAEVTVMFLAEVVSRLGSGWPSPFTLLASEVDEWLDNRYPPSERAEDEAASLEQVVAAKEAELDALRSRLDALRMERP